ncbi:MAG: hypothetical protein LAT51_12950 [Flavobacteriaceae bacterium]|nr:hypothetical protein [Flavobacteriaceae bacterium]
MEKLNVRDVEVLNFMVERLVLNNQITFDDFTQTTLDLEKNKLVAPNINEQDFIRYLYILDRYNVCKISATKDAEYARKTPATLNFNKQGGFNAIYDKIQKDKETEELDYRNKKVNLELAEKTLQEFPRTKWFARIGFFIAVILAFKEIIIIFFA